MKKKTATKKAAKKLSKLDQLKKGMLEEGSYIGSLRIEKGKDLKGISNPFLKNFMDKNDE